MIRELLSARGGRREWLAWLGCAAVALGCDSAATSAGTGSAGAGAGAAAGIGGTRTVTSATTASCVAGTERCPCYGNHTCNGDLICASELCVRIDTAQPLASGGTTSSATSVSSTGAAGSTSAITLHTGGAQPATTAPPIGAAGSTSRLPIGGSTSGGRAATGGSYYDPSTVFPACEGLIPSSNGSCVPTSLGEAKPVGLDLVLLIDRSISNSYAVGSETATPASAGQLRRWDLLTAALERFLIAPEVALNKVSLTFLSYTGSASPTAECNSVDYAIPAVALDTAVKNEAAILSAMQSVTPAGFSPIVPALTGAFRYAMSEQVKDPQREKVVVYIGDGFPNLCDLKSPSDIASVISEAAAAVTPIRTFIIGLGSPETVDAAKFNLLNYASAGDTGKPPYVIDETAGAEGAQNQLTAALLDISAAPGHCAYRITPASRPRLR